MKIFSCHQGKEKNFHARVAGLMNELKFDMQYRNVNPPLDSPFITQGNIPIPHLWISTCGKKLNVPLVASPLVVGFIFSPPGLLNNGLRIGNIAFCDSWGIFFSIPGFAIHGEISDPYFSSD